MATRKRPPERVLCKLAITPSGTDCQTSVTQVVRVCLFDIDYHVR